MQRMVELSWAQIEAMNSEKTVVVMPIASIEQHGKHLPVGTDYLLMEKFAAALCESSLPNVEGMVLPTLQFGLNTEHTGFPGSITLRQRTLEDILEEQTESFYRHGFRNFMFYNSHGGNFDMLDGFIRYYRTGHDCRMLNVDYFRSNVMQGQEQWVENPVGIDVHAGEFETALMLYLYPNLANMGFSNGELNECNVPANQLPCGWMAHEVSRSGVIGNAGLATQAKGKVYYESICRFALAAVEGFCQNGGE